MSTPSQFHRCWPDLPSWQLRCAPHSQLHSFTGAGPFEFAQGRLGIRASRRDSITVSQVHSFTARKAELAENEGEGRKVQRLLLLAASLGTQAERTCGVDPVEFSPSKIAIWSIGIPPGGRGGGGVPILPLILNILDGLVANKTVLYRRYAHICWTGSNEHLPQKEAATRVGIAAFLFLLLIPVYALEGYWTARVHGGFESLVTRECRIGKGGHLAVIRLVVRCRKALQILCFPASPEPGDTGHPTSCIRRHPNEMGLPPSTCCNCRGLYPTHRNRRDLRARRHLLPPSAKRNLTKENRRAAPKTSAKPNLLLPLTQKAGATK